MMRVEIMPFPDEYGAAQRECKRRSVLVLPERHCRRLYRITVADVPVLVVLTLFLGILDLEAVRKAGLEGFGANIYRGERVKYVESFSRTEQGLS